MSERPVCPVREDLLDHGVVAVLLLGPQQRFRFTFCSCRTFPELN
jgi:hypothetical protein